MLHETNQSKLHETLNTAGWALPKRSNTRFSFKQRKFLYEEFMAGGKTGKKATPDGILRKMRSLRDKKNTRLFFQNEYLSMFSRMTKALILGKLTETKANQADEVVSDDLQYAPDDEIDENVIDAMESVRDHFTLTVNGFVCISRQSQQKKSFRAEHFVGENCRGRHCTYQLFKPARKVFFLAHR